MKILWIYLENFKCYRRIRVPYQGILPDGLIFVDGDNSSGKSSLFDAIFYAFFYDPSGEREIGTKDELVRKGASLTKVNVVFSLANSCYEVRREHEKDKPVQAYLYKIDKQKALQGEISNRQELAKGVKEVNKKIVSLFNISSANALNTVIIRQGEVHELAEAKPANLRNIIYELFQLDFYKERANEIVKEKVQKLIDSLNEYQVEITTERLDTMIEQITKEIKKEKKEIERLDKKVEKLMEQLKQYPSFTDLQEISKIFNKITEREKILSQKQEKLDKNAKSLQVPIPISEKILKGKLKEISEKLKKITGEKEETSSKTEKLREKIAKLRALIEDEQHRKEVLSRIAKEEHDVAECEICEQEVDEKTRKKLLETLELHIPKIQTDLKNKDHDFKSLREKQKETEKEEEEFKQLNLKIEALERDFLDFAKETQEKETLSNQLNQGLSKFSVNKIEKLAERYELTKFDELFDRIQKLNLAKQSQQDEKGSKLRLISSKNENIEKWEKEKKENKKKEEKQAEINHKIDILKKVEKHVEGFITEDLIANKLIAGIQQSTNEYIYNFTRGRYDEIHLQPTRQKTLTMKVNDCISGFIKSQSQLSGGDRTAIGLGLRLGVSDLLKRVRPLKTSPYQPPRLDILILDEPLGSLDEGRRSKVVEALLVEKKFPQIFLITHTDVRKEISAPTISVRSSSKGSSATYYPAPTEVEEEAMDVSQPSGEEEEEAM